MAEVVVVLLCWYVSCMRRCLPRSQDTHGNEVCCCLLISNALPYFDVLKLIHVRMSSSLMPVKDRDVHVISIPVASTHDDSLNCRTGRGHKGIHNESNDVPEDWAVTTLAPTLILLLRMERASSRPDCRLEASGIASQLTFEATRDKSMQSYIIGMLFLFWSWEIDSLRRYSWEFARHVKACCLRLV